MTYLTHRMTIADVPADWTRRVRRLWSQDDAVPDEDTVTLAWRRLFGGPVPSGDAWIVRQDGGDHEYLVDGLGRVYLSSYPGANELGVLSGSPADVYPRIVISGGQTGADRGALDAGLLADWPIGGWAPRGFRAEDGQIPEAYQAHLWEAESADYDDRTRANVQDSDGTLIVSLHPRLTGGTKKTWDFAGQIRRPRLHVVAETEAEADRGRGDHAAAVSAWLAEHQIGVLNVAGPRESKQPGVGDAVRALLGGILLGRNPAAFPRSAPGEERHGGARAATTAVTVPVPSSLPVAVADRRTAVPTRSPSQEDAIRAALRWIADPRAPQVFLLAGVAGSGKSTIAREIVAESGRPWLYAAFTGKAALVMERKGCLGARTIHSTIYRPEGDPIVQDGGRIEPIFRLRDDSPLADAFGIVIDEGSMVDEEIGRDLLRFGKRILVLYDPAQLPPIEGAGFFTAREPDVVMTEVHRQARDSGILELATFVREGGDLFTRVGWRRDDCEVVSRDSIAPADLMQRMVAADQVIVGRNDTRHRLNNLYRRICQVSEPLPIEGDKVICLRNEHKTGLFNGSMWRVLSSTQAGPSTLDLEIETLDGLSPGRLTSRTWYHHFLAREPELVAMGVVRAGFLEFDYGYFITGHKSQGSQWDHVVVYDESHVFREHRDKWLYTAITRAAKRLLVAV